MFVRLLLAAVLAGAGVTALSEQPETWLMATCCSKHWRTGEHRYNEDNHGQALDYTLPGRDSVIVGAYRNSFYRQSAYVAYGWRTWGVRHDGLWIESRVLVGGITGYGGTDVEHNNYRLFLMPALTVRDKRFGVFVLGVPGILLGLGLEVRLP